MVVLSDASITQIAASVKIVNMDNNLDTAHFLDMLSDLAQHIESKGAVTVAREFRRNYPAHYQELLTQMNRGIRQQAFLLSKKNADSV